MTWQGGGNARGRFTHRQSDQSVVRRGVYLTAFDHWVKETLRCSGYVRYVDDFLLFADDKAQLTEWRTAIVGRLLEHRLHLNERKSRS